MAELKKLTTLDLGDNQLSDISGLAELKNLTTLYLYNNQLSDISGLAELKKLTTLDLGSNQLSDISGLAELKKLTTLYLNSNQLSDISGLAELKKLTTLYLNSNQLSDISGLAELKKLTTLYLSGNQLSDISGLAELKKLTTLDLYNNNIKELPEWITQWGVEIYCDTEYHEEGIVLGENPLEVPPVEIVKEGREAIQGYFRQLRKSEAETKKDHYLFEAKLLIIGEAGAGKTTFARKIEDPYAEMPRKEDTTRGIDVHRWVFEVTSDDFPKLKKLNIDRTPFYLNLWDFGGQEIFHGTHQFFFSEDSLYVLLGDTREQKTDFNFWLHTTEQLAGNSPLIIVLNKRQDYEWRIDQTGYLGRFGEIIKEIKTADLSNPDEIPELQKCIKYNLSTLPMIGDKLPASWVEIREKLSQESEEFIEYRRFKDICSEHGMTDIKDIELLSRYYHKIGVITHFINDPVLQERVYIDSNWLVQTIYRLLDNEEVKKQEGILTRTQVEEIWKDNKVYQEIDKLIQLMLRFGLLFKVRDKDEYIVPEHLKEEKPYKKWAFEADDMLEFHYELGAHMPKGLMARLIVELHHHIKDYALVWWRGVNVECNGAKAEVAETYGEDNKFVIRVSGVNQRDLLIIIREHFERILGRFKKLKPKKLIPCNCAKCIGSADPKMHIWDELQNFERLDINEIPCGKSGLKANVGKLLGRYGMVKKEEQDRREDPDGRFYIRDSKVVIKNGMTIERVEKMTQEKVINIGNGTVISAPIVVADQIENSFNTVAESKIDEELKELLQQLINEVNEAAKVVPAETADSMAGMWSHSVRKQPVPNRGVSRMR